ncbi:MAG: efflux transporter outer membrane subunit [Planctomycetota bacterium]
MLLLLQVLALTACTVGPNYEPPVTTLPAAWAETLPATASVQAADLSRWWSIFQDEQLDALIDEALAANLDLRAATSRLREARALRKIAGADDTLQLDAVAGASRSQRSRNAFAGGGAAPPGTTANFFNLGFDAAWELDLFGGIERAEEAAEAEFQAREEDRRDVAVTLLAEVSREYLSLRGAQRRLALAQENLTAQEETRGIVKARRDAGMANDLDLLRAEAQVASTRAELPRLQVERGLAAQRLDVLLARQPGRTLSELSAVQPLPPAPPGVPIGLPSELLLRRPDLRRAERRLAVASAQLGVAMADRYPSFTLTGNLGLQSRQTGNLLERASRTWTLGADLVWPLLNAGRLDAEVEAQDARLEGERLAYEQAVLDALQDCHASLLAYGREQERFASLAQAADAQARALELGRELYRGGLIDFLDVLQAQQQHLEAQDALVQSERDLSGHLVALYKALGGGWEELNLGD